MLLAETYNSAFEYVKVMYKILHPLMLVESSCDWKVTYRGIYTVRHNYQTP